MHPYTCDHCNGSTFEPVLNSGLVRDSILSEETAPEFGSVSKKMHRGSPKKDITAVRERLSLLGAVPQACGTVKGVSKTSSWTRIESMESVRDFIGKRVEIDAPRSDLCIGYGHGPASIHGWIGTVESIDDFKIGIKNQNSGVVGYVNWSDRGNVRLRMV